MKTISIQGVPGSFSHIAVESLFDKFEIKCHKDFLSTFLSLENDISHFAMIPIENSTVGSIIENYVHLSRFNFFVIAEVFVKVNFHLATLNDALFSNITEIYSHPAGLGQIKNFLSQNSRIKAIEFFDTAGAAEMINQSQDPTKAAACSRRAAEIHNLKILKENIHDNPMNYTRFFLISKNPQNLIPDPTNKTTIQFELPHKAGSLADFLNVFAKANISLTKIESRPIPNTDWEYRFFIDVLESVQNPKMQSCLESVNKICQNIRVLGCYQKGKIIES